MKTRDTKYQLDLREQKKELINLIYGICMSFARLKISNYFKSEKMYIWFPEGVHNIIKHLESTREDAGQIDLESALNFVCEVAKRKYSAYPEAYELFFSRTLETNLFYGTLANLNSINIENICNELKTNFPYCQALNIDKSTLCGNLGLGGRTISNMVTSFAAKNNCINIIKDFLAYENVSLFDMRYGMENACSNGRLEMVKLFLDDKRLDLSNEEFFISAIQSGNINVIKLLIEDGRTKFDVSNALIIASELGYFHLVEYFLANRDRKKPYIDSDKIVQGAAKNGHLEVLKLLTKNKAIMKDYKILFKIASDNNHFEMVKWLYQNFHGHFSDVHDNQLFDMKNQNHKLLAKQSADLFSEYTWKQIKAFNQGAASNAFIQFNIPNEIGKGLGSFLGRYDGIRLSRTCHTIFSAAKKSESDMELEHAEKLNVLIGKLS